METNCSLPSFDQRKRLSQANFSLGHACREKRLITYIRFLYTFFQISQDKLQPPVRLVIKHCIRCESKY
jgi:hypothetical protein